MPSENSVRPLSTCGVKKPIRTPDRYPASQGHRCDDKMCRDVEALASRYVYVIAR